MRIWNQAKLDNPDPEKFIPVPIVGFDELHKRLKNQEQQTQFHQTRLAVNILAYTFVCIWIDKS